MNKRSLVYVLAILVLVLATSQPALAAPRSYAPLYKGDAARVVPDQYIVVFNNAASNADVDAAVNEVRGVGQVDFVYTVALKGFAAKLPAAAVEGLRHNPNVAYIEQDQEVSTDTTQTGATWGIDRIDQRALPLNQAYNYTNTGSGVTAYIIDTGILTTHQEFGGRASTANKDFVKGKQGDGTDCNGHGTHVAGTVGGATYGVAKSVKLVAVRVLNCSGSGTTAGVIAGVDWVTANHVKPAVANMSLGGGVSSALDTAVSNSIAAGVTYGVSAGNSNANACSYSPARVSTAITVGATTSTDARASYSNYGACLDIFAPGSSITSAWYTSNTATNTISGTSMASPHVVGVAALYLQGNPNASPAQVASALASNATPGVVSNPGSGSPNRLLYTNY